MSSICVQDVCISHVISLNPMHLENIAHVVSEEHIRILKKFVHACVVNAIHAKVLPDSILYNEH